MAQWIKCTVWQIASVNPILRENGGRHIPRPSSWSVTLAKYVVSELKERPYLKKNKMRVIVEHT